MLQAKNISFSVGNKKIVLDFSGSFEAGQLHLILGPNGAGKSTVIKLLSGELPSKTGSIHINGKEQSSYSLLNLAKIRAVLSQNIELSFPLKVHEVVMMGRYPHFNAKPSTTDFTACEEAMQFFDVTIFQDRDYLTLSGGEKQRVHFARVLAQITYTGHDGCHYLFLDEPLTFLDVYYQFQFMRKLKELLESKTLAVIGVVHDLNLAARFSDKLSLLHQGKLIASGTPEIVLEASTIEKAYGIKPMLHKTDERTFLFFE